MNEKRWERNLADAARGYNEPPETPRERMWQRIDTARGEARGVDHPTSDPWWSRRQVLWPAAVVAALAIGLTAGRYSVDTGGPVPLPTTTVVADTSGRDPDPRVQTYRLAAMPILERSESLLLQVGTEAETSGPSGSFGDRAVDLLGRTRLLLASPAKDDPELKRLLEDLELALARIVRLAATPHAVVDTDSDRRALEDGLQRNAVLPRIRERLSTGTSAVEL